MKSQIFLFWIAAIALAFATIFSPSCRKNESVKKLIINPGNGRIFRIYELDIQNNQIKWEGNTNFKYQRDNDSVSYVLLDSNARSLNTLELKPNRSYIISVLMQADFPRPVEVNIGLQTMDGGGKQVMWHLNGIPNKTNGWQRWQWEFTTDQRAVHGHFAAQIYDFPKNGVLKIADIAFVELPEKPLVPYAKGEGVTFRGGPGNLPMRIEKVLTTDDSIQVRTTGALYTFFTKGDSISARQMLEKERIVSIWQASTSLKGLKVLRQNNKECVLVNDQLTIGVQCDGLMMVSPLNELILTCKSKIGGKWNRLATGNMLIVDEWGGFAVNPDIPLGTGRMARVDAGLNAQPGRGLPGDLDFADIIDNQTFVSRAKPGWKVKWFISPGERLAISVFPPKPYPWKDSFRTHWMLSDQGHTDTSEYSKWKNKADIVLLWDYVQRAWAFSWGHEHFVADEPELNNHIAAIKNAGMRPIIYMSPYYYYSRDAAELSGEAKRLKEKYKIEGVYFDGIPSQEWTVAYEEMRMTREIFADGIIILHNTGHPYNGIPPLGDPSIKIPAIETYADANFGGELVYGEGKDWAYPKYIEAQYRLSNTVGAMVMWDNFGWKGFTPLQQDLMMLLYNGRSQDKSRYKPYIEKLEKLWQQKGADPDFYEKYYLPEVKKMTKGLLPE